MKVIFTETIANVAFAGQVKNVRPGFYRNYLLPYGKAVLATANQLALWERKRQELLMEKEQIVKQAEEVKGRLEMITLKIEKKVTGKGTLYSAITEKDVAEALKKQAKLSLSPNDITLAEHIKELGMFEIPVTLASNVKGIVKLEVIAKQ